MNGLFHTDLQCPGWYGGFPFLRTEAAFEASDPGWETLEHWFRVYPNKETDATRRRQRVALDLAKDQAAASAASSPRSRLAPFVFNSAEASEDDMVEYILHCRRHGASHVIVFMPKPDLAAHDYWRRVIPRASV
jgi:hypothetical protein